MGAAVVGSISYILNKNLQKQDQISVKDSYNQQVAKICIAAAENYLSSFSSQGLSILAAYQQKAAKVICFAVSQEPIEITQQRENLQRLQNQFNQLLSELKRANITSKYQPYQDEPKSANPQIPKQQVYIPQNPPPKVEPPRQQVNTPPPNPAELEAKFRAWELEQEIAEIKVNMKSPNSHQKSTNPPKTQAQKDKIADAYRVLGLQPTASFTEVKQTYKTLVKKWHPDLFVNQPQMQKQVQEKMRLVNEAYNILNDHHG